MDFEKFLNALINSGDYEDQIVHIEKTQRRPARFAELSKPLPNELVRALSDLGIRQLYTHQVDAIEAISQGKDIVVVTSTASGKTLCYNLPVAETMLREPQARAIYIFPTKALAQDQLRTLKSIGQVDAALKSLDAGAYDGDTTQYSRRKIRDKSRIILTNPDMLHQGILPHHPKWARVLCELKYVIIDEIHTYRGCFGSNVANVIRRLNRICDHYGARPQYICCSATIANPVELAEAIVGREMTLIDDDGAPRGAKFFALWNPPFLSKRGRERKSSNVEAQKLLVKLMKNGVQTIAFTKARVVTELIYRYAKEQLEGEGLDLADRIRAYRSGYLPEERRAIEGDLFSGRLLGVTSTVALELGIDVGSLDACLMVGFPGTIASTRQQAGRAGRASEDSLVVLIAYNDPVDQYIMRQPQYILGQSPENAVVDYQNPYILAGHLGCAAYEAPLSYDDRKYFGDLLEPLAEILEETGQTKKIDDRWYWSTTDYPAGKINLRTISDDTFSIIDRTASAGEALGELDSISAMTLVYPGAIYLHSGESYLVRELDLETKVAYVEGTNADYYTQPVFNNTVKIVEQREEKVFNNLRVSLGDANVTRTTAFFNKFKFYSSENLGSTKLDLPPQSFQTSAFWIAVPKHILDKVRADGMNPMEGLAGFRNMLVVALPMIAMCDRRDVSGSVDSSNTGAPTVFVYDMYIGGLGFAEKGYELIDNLLDISLEMIEKCDCENGCPSCVALASMRLPTAADLGGFSGWAIPDKRAAASMLKEMLESEGGDAVIPDVSTC